MTSTFPSFDLHFLFLLFASRYSLFWLFIHGLFFLVYVVTFWFHKHWWFDLLGGGYKLIHLLLNAATFLFYILFCPQGQEADFRKKSMMKRWKRYSMINRRIKIRLYFCFYFEINSGNIQVIYSVFLKYDIILYIITSKFLLKNTILQSYF